jgi:hypothetical protein
VSPPWLSEPHLQVQCDESPRLDLACGVHSTGRLRPPLVAACATHRVRYAFPIRNGGCVPRLAYAPRSWSGMRALRDLSVFHLQIRPEHRCVRERAQHTCVFICGLDTFTTGGLRPPLLVARCWADAPNAERSERTADIGESRIRASLIGEWILLPPVALFAC